MEDPVPTVAANVANNQGQSRWILYSREPLWHLSEASVAVL